MKLKKPDKHLKIILQKHLNYLHGKKKQKRADLQWTRLSHVDLSGVDLEDACMTHVDLHDANLRNANLCGADLTCANLSGADLSGADLVGANLDGADLTNANLSNADCDGADMTRAVLYMADLTRASLVGATFEYANLNHANLHGANLTRSTMHRAEMTYTQLDDAVLTGAELDYSDMYCASLINTRLTHATLSGVMLNCSNLTDADFEASVLDGINFSGSCVEKAKNVCCSIVAPSSGAFVGWKKAVSKDGKEYIVKLLVPEDARRLSASGRKCRCDKAEVLAIETVEGKQAKIKTAYSMYDSDFVYRVGKTVKIKDFCENRWQECAPGIHFFIDRQEAVDYNY